MNARIHDAAPPGEVLHRQTRVGLRIDGRDEARRISEALVAADANLHIANPDDFAAELDVVVADHPVETGAPLVLLARGLSYRFAEINVRALVDPRVSSGTLAAIIRLVAAGYSVMPASLDRGLNQLASEPGLTADETPLTAREHQVLALLVEGASNKVIARRLGVSPSTAKFHVASILNKLGATNRSDAIAVAIRRGLILL